MEGPCRELRTFLFYAPVALTPLLPPQFGFAEGGSIRLQIFLYDANGTVVNSQPGRQSTGVYLLTCGVRACPLVGPSWPAPPTHTAYTRQVDAAQSARQLLKASPGACLPAVAFAQEQCPLPPLPVPVNGTIQESVPDADTLVLTLLNCNGDDIIAVGISYVLLNPGGQNLGTAQAPLPWMYIAYATVWMLLIVCDAIHIGRLRLGLSLLQASLLAVPALKVLNMAVAAAKWSSLNTSGLKSPPLDVGVDITSTCSSVALLAVILLLSRGWLVNRAALGAPERNSLMLSLSLLAALYFVYFLYSTRSLPALSLAYVAVLGIALTSVSHGLRHLRAQAQLLRVSASTEVQAGQAWTRVSMFSAFHVALFVFTSAEVVLHLVALFVTGSSWLTLFFTELADLAMAFTVGLIFRARNPSPFVGDDTEEVLAAAAGSVIAAGRGGFLGDGVPTDEDIQTAIGRGFALPPSRSNSGMLDARRHAASGGSGQQQQQQAPPPESLPVLVENPCSFDANGRPLFCVSVGLLHTLARKRDSLPGGGLAAPSDVEMVTHNPLWHARHTETQPRERDLGPLYGWAAPADDAPAQPQEQQAPPTTLPPSPPPPSPQPQTAPQRSPAQALTPQQVLQLQQQAAADRFRALWGAPGFTNRGGTQRRDSPDPDADFPAL